MPNFSYRALGRDGKEIRGVLQAENETAAASKIRENYPILLHITSQTERQTKNTILETEIGNKRIKTKDLSILCSQFSIILHSGIPVSRAMQMLSGQCSDKRLKKVLESSAKEVLAGSTVADALEKHQERFPLTFIETIRAGEQSGTLDRSFDRLYRFYDKSYKTTERIKNALTYPIFVILITVVVLIIVMAKVIPTLADVFSDLGGDLPLMTQIMISVSAFFADWWILMIAIIVLFCFLFRMYTKTPKGNIQKDKLLLSLPVIGTITQMNASAQFANTMSVLLAADITLDQAIATTAKVMEHALFQEEIFAMKSWIEQGRTLSDCLNNSKCFPQTMIDMCSVGEETGELEKTLENIADYYTNEADYRIQRLLSMLEPALLVLLSIFAGFIVIAIYLPIFTMYDLM